MNQATAITLIVIEATGLVITIGVGIAAFVAYRRTKKRANEVIKRGKPYVKEFKKLLRNLSEIEDF